MFISILFVAQVQLFECPIHIQWEKPLVALSLQYLLLNICQEIHIASKFIKRGTCPNHIQCDKENWLPPAVTIYNYTRSVQKG